MNPSMPSSVHPAYAAMKPFFCCDVRAVRVCGTVTGATAMVYLFFLYERRPILWTRSTTGQATEPPKLLDFQPRLHIRMLQHVAVHDVGWHVPGGDGDD